MFVHALLLSTALVSGEIEVHEKATGCYLHNEVSYAWRRDGERWVDGARSLTREQVDAIRATVLAAPETVPNLLATVGVTPRTLAREHDTILRAALPRTWGENGLPLLTPELEALLGYESIAPRIEDELLGRNWGSTSALHFEVTLPGDPPVHVGSRGLVDWMLPWTITAGERTWQTPDVRVSRAMLVLADPEGPCAHMLDGEEYWTRGFYENDSFWGRWVGGAIDTAFSEQRYTRLPGFEEANHRFRVESVTTGNINLHPESMYFLLSTRTPALIDRARWYNPIVDGEPSLGWDVFVGTFARCLEAAQRHPWLAEWKYAAPDRSLRIECWADQAHGERYLDKFVTPAWKDAGCAGEPEIQVALVDDTRWQGTIYLSTADERALIVRAKPTEGAHWLDPLDVPFHPKTPTYAVVEPDGTYAVRTIGE